MTIKKFQIIISLLIINCFYSQIKFEKGYFIDNSGKKTECLIKNIDWNYNPTSFEYKLSDNEKHQNTIKNVKEFGIYNESKYLRFDILIDESSENISNLQNDPEPIFKTKNVFLKLLLEGDANLYIYNNSDNKKFFYSSQLNTQPKQLIYIVYNVDENKIGYNNLYKKQINEILDCSSVSDSEIERVAYKENSLINIFSKYNQCKNPSISENIPTNKNSFNLNLRPRISTNSLSINNSVINTSIDFDKKITFSLGLEAELILPFNKNKWSVLIEPQYQYFKNTNKSPSTTFSGNYLISEINYKTIDLPIGIRHYFFLNKKSTIFINALYSINLDLGSDIQFTRIDRSRIYEDIKIKSNGNLVLGAGYKYDKYSLEIRMNTNRNILSDYALWNSKYNYTSIILGYTLF